MDFLKSCRVYKFPINFGPAICWHFALIYDEHHRNSDIVSAVLTKLKLTASNCTREKGSTVRHGNIPFDHPKKLIPS